MTRKVHTSRAIKGTKGAGASPATTGIAKDGAHKLKARSKDLRCGWKLCRYRGRQECQPARRMGLAVMEKVKEGKEKEEV